MGSFAAILRHTQFAKWPHLLNEFHIRKASIRTSTMNLIGCLLYILVMQRKCVSLPRKQPRRETK